MFNKKRIVAIIPARKGSKRIKNKNAILIKGKPMFEHSINVAKMSQYIDDIIFSTDCEKWLNYAHKLGCIKNKIRPKYLSTDKSRTINVILYELNKVQPQNYDVVVLLQPTSPYRTVEMLDKAIEKYFETETSLITIVEAKEQPIFMRRIRDGKLKKIVESTSEIRSQDFEKIYRIIGSIYINNIKTLTENTILNENEIGFVIDNKYGVDIDNIDDLEQVKKIMEE